MKNKFLYLITSFILSGCGGSSGSNNAPTVSIATEPIKPDIVLSMGEFDAEFLGEAPIGFNGLIPPHILAIGDVNQDGYDDILISNSADGIALKPTLLLYNPISHSYVVDEKFKQITQPHLNIRRGSIADVDGDGRNDIII